jgi:hypothetical protein
MKYLTVAICLSIAVLVGCGGVSDSADSQNKLAAAQEEGIDLFSSLTHRNLLILGTH